MRRRILRLLLIGLIVLGGNALALVSFKHVHTSDGDDYDNFDLYSAETLTMEGKAPAGGDLHVQLDRLGNEIEAQFDVSDGACNQVNLGSIGPFGFSFYSEVSDYSSGTGCAGLRNSSLAKLCPNCSGS